MGAYGLRVCCVFESDSIRRKVGVKMCMAAFTGMQTGGHIFFYLTPATLSYSTLLSGLGVLEGLKGISTPKPTQQTALFSPPLVSREYVQFLRKGAG